MGWDSYHVDSPVKRKVEMDKQFNWSEKHETGEEKTVRVLKSAMVGSTYYAAVEIKDQKADEHKVIAVIALTRLNKGGVWYNFACKSMDESMNPNEAECPVSILKLLTPTEDKLATRWRERCWEYAKLSSSEDALNKLPYGSVIECVWCGEKISLVKRRPSRQFRTAWWQIYGKNEYIPKRSIPEKYTVLMRGDEVA